ncbi:DUF58 domain-containing protein [Alicyclobacillus dauci]|uniref:DUF58 domain-containing protein n=1 Tax=Alicyclobacillus dauci TaxID=1475485 RepID=A0ABY6Z1N3_9BACL|nr:DUF58 domain-containing protein [Alicyclobacillus dauci]WAH36655.1 DUF58 domain-containing protein [Alicyclobacillus dauci]
MRLRAVVSALAMLVLTVGLFIFGKITGGFFAWFLFYFFLVVAVYEWITMFASLTRVTSHRQLSLHRLTAGQTLDVQVSLARRGVWPLFWLRIHEALPPRWLFQTNGLERIHVPLWTRKMEYAYSVQNVPRGVYELGDTKVETGDLFGFVRGTKTFEGRDKVIIYPKVVPVRGWSGHSPDDYGDRQPTNRRSEDSSNVIGVRDYVKGDRLNRIHWPVTARRGQLQAKEFELHVTSEFLFIPDNTEASYSGDSPAHVKFDLSMCITASLLRHAYDNHRKFGMMVPTEPYVFFPTGLDAALLTRCMESLASMQPDSKRDVISFLRRVGDESTRGTVFVIVSPRLDQEMAVAVSRLKRQGTVHLFVPTVRDRLTDSERTGVELLQSAGAQVYLIRKPEQLSFLHKGGASGATISSY